MIISKEKRREIAIILQLEQYKGVEITEDLIREILLKIDYTEEEITSVIEKANTPPKGANLGTWDNLVRINRESIIKTIDAISNNIYWTENEKQFLSHQRAVALKATTREELSKVFNETLNIRCRYYLYECVLQIGETENITDEKREDLQIITEILNRLCADNDTITLLAEEHFNIENQLTKDGFVLDSERDEHSVYYKDGLYVVLHWSGDMLNDEGYCISMRIYSGHNRSTAYSVISSPSMSMGPYNPVIRDYSEYSNETLYYGERPNNIEDYKKLFELLHQK
jgi:hypothetical protein